MTHSLDRYDLITFQTLTQHVYIADVTSDGVNIDVFLAQITDISILYIQDKNSPINWVRYTVQGITIYDAYVDIDDIHHTLIYGDRYHSFS